MKKFFPLVFILLLSFDIMPQSFTIGFEGMDSLTLPQGWKKWHRTNYPIFPFCDWTVRDTGRSLPGLSTATSKAHTGRFAIGISWWSGVDTTGTDTTDISDEWLVSQKIHVWAAGAYMSYWMALGGGSAPYRDSVQIWISTVDSTPQSFTHKIETISGTGPYGTFTQQFIPFDDYVGQDIWVGFRYYMDVEIDGYFVHMDDIEVVNPPIGIKPLSGEVPTRFDLKQNYPNPFNPVTNIEFDLPKSTAVRLIVYNSIGQEVELLVNQNLAAGRYRVDFNASRLPSGTYFYRLVTGDYVETQKMVLVK